MFFCCKKKKKTKRSLFHFLLLFGHFKQNDKIEKKKRKKKQKKKKINQKPLSSSFLRVVFSLRASAKCFASSGPTSFPARKVEKRIEGDETLFWKSQK
jgi:hypothetical protein